MYFDKEKVGKTQSTSTAAEAVISVTQIELVEFLNINRVIYSVS
jgi:hypothetical protein